MRWRRRRRKFRMTIRFLNPQLGAFAPNPHPKCLLLLLGGDFNNLLSFRV